MPKIKIKTPEVEPVKKKSKGRILNAVFFENSKKPICPKCLIPLSHEVNDYGLTDKDDIYFVSECKSCDSFSKYITDSNLEVIKVKIVERN